MENDMIYNSTTTCFFVNPANSHMMPLIKVKSCSNRFFTQQDYDIMCKNANLNKTVGDFYVTEFFEEVKDETK